MQRWSVSRTNGRSKLVACAAVAAMALAFGAGCLEDADVAKCKQECPSAWNQVCGDDGVTYRNDCHASCKGVGVVHTGAC